MGCICTLGVGSQAQRNGSLAAEAQREVPPERAGQGSTPQWEAVHMVRLSQKQHRSGPHLCRSRGAGARQAILERLGPVRRTLTGPTRSSAVEMLVFTEEALLTLVSEDQNYRRHGTLKQSQCSESQRLSSRVRRAEHFQVSIYDRIPF